MCSVIGLFRSFDENTTMFSFKVATSLSVFIFGSHFRILVDFILSPGLVGNSVLITIGKFGKEPKGTEIDNLNIFFL